MPHAAGSSSTMETAVINIFGDRYNQSDQSYEGCLYTKASYQR